MLKEIAEVVKDFEITGETRLWQAVIITTIQEWISGPLRRQREAEEYLFNDSKDFPSVCESAGMDMVRLRRELGRLRKRCANPTLAAAA